MDVSVHPTAVVEPGADLGEGTRVWHHAHVRAGARVGSSCVLGKNVYVDTGVVIGAGSHIQNNVSVYAGVTLGRGVFVGPHAVFTNDRLPRAGSDDWEIVPTDVRDGASIGANATIVGGNVIGPWAMVGAGTVVTRDVMAHELVVGVPARRAGWVCRRGHVVSRQPEVPADPISCPRCGSMVPEDPPQ